MRTFIGALIVAAACLIPSVLPLEAQQIPGLSAKRPPARCDDCDRIGPKVGERVPEFQLLDQGGKTQTLDSIMGPKGALLVFVRSADW
jgi:hypothetical protein